jgi:hypothetical protein
MKGMKCAGDCGNSTDSQTEIDLPWTYEEALIRSELTCTLFDNVFELNRLRFRSEAIRPLSQDNR